MYLLFLDESGTHASSSAFFLAGIAIHELDAPHLAKRLEGSLNYRLAPLGLNARDFELHAKDIRPGVKEWAQVPEKVRFQVLGGTYRSIETFQAVDAQRPWALFGAIVDRRYQDREQRAYELVLNKFDGMLEWIYRRQHSRESGLVIHDKRVVDTPMKPGASSQPWNLERRIQEWTRDWQEVAGRIGQLRNFAEIPLFVDSRATRLIQVADFVSWGLQRFYNQHDPRWIRGLWDRFDSDPAGRMHGAIHMTPDYGKGLCACPPCDSRAD